MRILHVNKYLYRRGGAESYMQDVAELQSQAGHRVEFFGMQHPANEPQALAAHFPSYLELDPPPDTLLARAKAAGRIVYSVEARRRIDGALAEFGPDLAHLHNVYHHLSPSILQPLRNRNIPTVMTLHDYKLACPTYRFLDHGRICEACIGGKFHRAVLRRCHRGSLTASTTMAAELFIHTAVGAYSSISRFICPSRFMAEKMSEAGVYASRLRWVPHFVDASAIAPKNEPGGGVVYAGRLAPEKGVDVLIRAVGRLDRRSSLTIAGDGPERATLTRLAEAVAPGRVHFRGRMSRPQVLALFRSSAVAVLPARWYENQPMSILEAFACGLPVVGSKLGGIPELIRSGIDGQLVPPDDDAALAAALEQLLADPDQARTMGRAARAKVLDEFSPESHLARLQAVYEEAAAAPVTAA